MNKAITSSIVVVEPTVIGLRVMTRSIGVVAGSRPAATTRERTSRSVKIPTSRPPSITSVAPTLWLFITFTAAATVISWGTEKTTEPLCSSKTATEVFMGVLVPGIQLSS